MSFYNTGNPVPSIDPRDLDDNAKILDDFANGTSPTYVNRLGVERKSLFGIESDADSALLRSDLANSVDPLKGAGIVGYRGRTIYKRLNENPSVLDFAGVFADGITDSTAGINAAISWCSANSLRLFWPYGTYLAAGNLVGFHSISHCGKGVITRGANAFTLSPSAADTNNLYLSPTGSDSNDGLSSSFPRLTLIGAGTALEKFGPYLDGTWAVNLGAGTYSQSNFTFPSGLRGRNPVYFKGPLSVHPASPTAIVDGGGTGSFGFNMNRENTVYLMDLWFRNYTAFGIVGQDGSMLYAIRTHVTGVPGGPGVKMQQGRLVWSDGKVTTCQIGFSFIAGCTFTITSATPTLGSGTIIANNTQAGVQAQEQSSGHVDYAYVDTNPVGYQLVARSRVHSLLSVITNSVTSAVRGYGASDWFNNQTSLTANANNELFYTGSIEVVHYQDNVSPTRRPLDSTFITHTGTAATTTLKTYSDAFVANNFWNSTKSMRFVVVGELTGVAGNKNITINVAGVAVIGFTIPAAATGSYVIDGTLTALSATQQTYHAVCTVNGVSPQVASGARGAVMNSGTVPQATITATLVSSADSLTVRSVALFET